MLLLIPSDSPRWALEGVSPSPHPKALLRAGGAVAPATLLRFPLILDPEEIPAFPEKKALAVLSPDYAWIRWAKERGMRAVWLNPQGRSSPEPHPPHDLEISDLAALKNPLEFRLPDLAETLTILRGHGVPENVIAHAAAVAGVAFFLAERLREKGIAVDPLLVHRGGLLHDLDKIASLNEGGAHGQRAAELLANLGYPELAEIARRHVLRPGQWPRTWPEKIVFLADKLLEGAEVVGLSARLLFLKERYPEFQEEIAAGEVFARALQNQILVALGFTEPELLEMLRARNFHLPRL